MPDPIRCPYCVQGNHFKVMTAMEGGQWFQCDRCAHMVTLTDSLFRCPCLKCFDLQPRPTRSSRPPALIANQRA
jgi:hypothetical protein